MNKFPTAKSNLKDNLNKNEQMFNKVIASTPNNFKGGNSAQTGASKFKESSMHMPDKTNLAKLPKEGAPISENPIKIKKQRLKLEENLLFYSENGIRKFYEIMEKTEFKQKSNNDEHNLNKMIMLFKNWHFMCFPKYDIDFFISKINELGRKPSAKAYMSRLRKIYKGEENWDVMYNDQEEILNANIKKNKDKTANENSKEHSVSSPSFNKMFSEDNTSNNNIPGNSLNFGVSSEIKARFNFNYSNNTSHNNNSININNQLNRISAKLTNVEITNNIKKDLTKIDNNNKDETDVQELFFQDLENEYGNEKNFLEINEQDYDNFDHFEEDHSVNNDVRSNIHNQLKIKNKESSETSSIYKREKRLHSQAFGRDQPLEGDDISVRSSKKMKLD